MRALIALFAGALFAAASIVGADNLPTSWDGLVEVKSKKMEYVYLLPNADFRPYSKIQYDPVEIATRKDWLRNYNDSAALSARRLSDSDVRAALTEASGKFNNYFADEFSRAGYKLVSAAGPDVLRVSVAVVNLEVSAPDTNVGIGGTFTADAGQAALIVEVRDSLTNQLLGRAIDRQLAGAEGPMRRTSAGNWADFEHMFQTWAKVSVQGLGELKALSPIDTSGMQKK